MLHQAKSGVWECVPYDDWFFWLNQELAEDLSRKCTNIRSLSFFSLENRPEVRDSVKMLTLIATSCLNLESLSLDHFLLSVSLTRCFSELRRLRSLILNVKPSNDDDDLALSLFLHLPQFLREFRLVDVGSEDWELTNESVDVLCTRFPNLQLLEVSGQWSHVCSCALRGRV